MLFLLILNLLVFSKVNKITSTNALEIIYTDETWGTDIVSFNIFYKNSDKLIMSDFDSSLLLFTYTHTKELLDNLSKKIGFNYKSSFEYGLVCFSIYIEKQVFLKKHEKILNIFLNNKFSLNDFKKTKKVFLNKSYNTNLSKSILKPLSKFMYTSSSLINKVKNINLTIIENLKVEKYKEFIKYFKSPSNVLITLSNFNDIVFLLKSLNLYKANIYNKKTVIKNYLVNSVKKDFILYDSLEKKTSLKMGFNAPRCSSINSIYYDLLVLLINDLNINNEKVFSKYRCYKNFAYFEINFLNIRLHTSDLIKSFYNNIGYIAKTIEEEKVKLYKKRLINKYKETLYSKVDFMYLIGKFYLLTNNLESYLNYKYRVNLIERNKLISLINKISNSNYYKVVIKG